MSRGDTLFVYMVLCIQYRGHYGLCLEKKEVKKCNFAAPLNKWEEDSDSLSL